MLKLHIETVKAFLGLTESEVMRGCDGKIYFTATRQGDHIVIAEDRRCRYCGHMKSYGKEGSMMCDKNLKRSDEDAVNCKEFFWFTETKK